MSNEQLVTLQEAIDKAIEAENEHLDEIKGELEELKEYEQQIGTSDVFTFARRWYQMRIDAAKDRIAYLRVECDAVTLGKVE